MNRPISCEYIEAADGAQLFTLYRAPSSKQDRKEAYLICNPAPFEIFRCHWARNQMSIQLAKAGYHSLCFDYQSTGDSSGSSEDMDLDCWRSNIKTALKYLRSMPGVRRVSVLGMRLGASLAIQVLEKEKAKDLIIWEPIFDGPNYIANLRTMHRRMIIDNVYEPPFPSPQALTGQLLGYPFKPKFENQLRSINISEIPVKVAQMKVLTSRRHKDLNQFVSFNQDQVDHCQVFEIEENYRWTDWRFLNQQLIPRESIQLVAKCAKGLSA